MLARMDMILASGSPRRRELLAAAGYEFRIVSPEVEEFPPGTHPFRKLCAVNAALKAREVAEAHPEAVVLAADTMVGLDGEVLGKPVDLEEARGMLAKLSGRVHEVCTGVCVRQGDEESAFFEVTWVKFHAYGPAVVEEYLGKVEVMDKAGAYGIQECGDLLVDRIEGEYANVVGLPVARVVGELERFGLRRGVGMG
jgi:septum formation protein